MENRNILGLCLEFGMPKQDLFGKGLLTLAAGKREDSYSGASNLLATAENA